MARKKSPPPPPSPETRDYVLTVIKQSEEPILARSLAERLEPPHQVKAAVLEPLLDEFVTLGMLHAIPGKTPTAKRRYWDRDAREFFRANLVKSVAAAAAPLTAAELARKVVSPLKLSEAEVKILLEALVAAGTVYAIPSATSKGKPRYWNCGVLEFGRLALLKVLDEKGPQAESGLRKALKGFSEVQASQVIQRLLADRMLYRHPPLGKVKKELLGRKPPSPEAYLGDVRNQLTKVVAQLIAAEVPHIELRRAMVQLVEAAGVSFATPGTVPGEVRSPPPGAAVDLVALMKRIEPGAERGALVGARDLRRAAKLEKQEFDNAVLDLARRQRLSLHRHDFAASLSPAERDELVTDGNGTYFVGVAIRQSET